MSTAPKADKKRTLAEAGEEAEPVTRLEKARKDGLEPEMPDNPAPHIIAWLMEAGPVEIAGMDRVPISWATVDSWRRCTGVALEPWQAKLLRRLSADYLNSSRKAEKPDCPAPWSAPTTEDRREVVDRKVRALFDGLMQRTR